MFAAKTKARSALRPARMPGLRNEAHELHIRVVGYDPRIGNHLQLTASALAMEARRTDDLRLARILLGACARITAVARAHDELQALDLSDQVDVARRLPEICNELQAAIWGDGDAQAERETRAVNLIAGDLVATAVQEGAHGKGVCVSLGQAGSGRQLSVLPSTRQQDNAGLRMLRAFAARFGAAPQCARLPEGASISVFID